MTPEIKTAYGKIGLWCRIDVPACPYCGKAHYHDNAEPDATVDAPCGRGKYTLDCRRVRVCDGLYVWVGDLNNQKG